MVRIIYDICNCISISADVLKDEEASRIPAHSDYGTITVSIATW